MTSKKEYPSNDDVPAIITAPCKYCGSENSLIILDVENRDKDKLYKIRCIACNTIVKLVAKDKRWL